MKKSLFLFLMFLLFGSLCTFAIAKPTNLPRPDPAELKNTTLLPIRVGYFNGPPHIFFDEKNKKISGAVFDLIENHIAPEMGVKFHWEVKPTTIPRQLNQLENSKRFIACLLTFVPNRLEYSIYSKNPFFYGHPIIAVLKGNPLKKVEKASDLSHMVIGYVQNTYVTPFMRHPSIRLDLVGSPDFQEINLKKAAHHRIDGVYSLGKGSTLYYLQKLGLGDEFNLIELPEQPLPFHMVFSKDLGEFAEKFDQIFERLGGQNLYLELLSRYIDVSKL